MADRVTGSNPGTGTSFFLLSVRYYCHIIITISSMESDSLSIETLVKTVARAFYDDTAVLILDTLLREKFVPDDEIRLRLKLPRNEKDEIGKTLTQLEKEMLIKFESVTIEERGRAKKCYYIDYQTFFSVVRYRMHLMVAILKERKKETKTNYQCPTCHATFNELDVERYRAKDMYFVCRSCCPDDFRDIDSEPAFRFDVILRHMFQLIGLAG